MARVRGGHAFRIQGSGWSLSPWSWQGLLRFARPGLGEIADRRLAFGLWFAHELANGVKDNGELLVVLPLQLRHLPRQIGMRGEHLAQSNERTHDLHIYLYGPFTVEHAGKHGDALFGEGVGVVATSAVI